MEMVKSDNELATQKAKAFNPMLTRSLTTGNQSTAGRIKWDKVVDKITIYKQLLFILRIHT